MSEIRFVCNGKPPGIMFDPMPEEVLEAIRTGRTTPKDRREAKLVAEGKIWHDKEGKLAIPRDYFFACLREAGKLVQYKGKMNITNAEATLLPGLLSIKEEFLPMTDGEGWEVDKRTGRNNDGTANCIVRPLFRRWSFRGTLIVNDNEISSTKARELVDKGGLFKGLGAHRLKGPFGRFEVTEWKVIGGEKKKEAQEE